MYQIQQRETVKLWTEAEGKRRKTHSKCIKFKGSLHVDNIDNVCWKRIWWRISIFIVIDMTKMKPMDMLCAKRRKPGSDGDDFCHHVEKISNFSSLEHDTKKLNQLFFHTHPPVHHINISVVNMNLWRWDEGKYIFKIFVAGAVKMAKDPITKLSS